MFRHLEPIEELYDFKIDPDEATNLVDDPTFAHLLEEVRAKLDDWNECAK